MLPGALERTTQIMATTLRAIHLPFEGSDVPEFRMGGSSLLPRSVSSGRDPDHRQLPRLAVSCFPGEGRALTQSDQRDADRRHDRRPPLVDISILGQDEDHCMLAAGSLVPKHDLPAQSDDIGAQSRGADNARPCDLAKELLGKLRRSAHGAGRQALELVGLVGVKNDRRGPSGNTR